ncbi:MAG: VanZ family protein [bacterium]|nr:VanZ family protein [bacterium]
MKTLDIIVIVIVYLLFFFKKWQKKGIWIFTINTLIYIYISAVLYFTLMPIITSIPQIFHHSSAKMNLNLFEDLINGRGDYLRQIILNIIMTIPFGFLINFKTTKNSFLKTAGYTLLFSLTIEILQPIISSRSSDITDIFTNTIGGIIGYFLFKIANPFINNYIKKEDLYGKHSNN